MRYFTYEDGTEDSFTVGSAKERDFNLKVMQPREDFKAIAESMQNGEYGALKKKVRG